MNDKMREFLRFRKMIKEPEKYFKEKKVKDTVCAGCGTYDHTYPLPVNVCDQCSARIYPRAINTAKVQFGRGTERCFYCRCRLLNYFSLNAFFCFNCLTKISKAVEKKVKPLEAKDRHKLNKKEESR